MMRNLTKEEMLATNGGREVTPENLGEAIGSWVGKAIMAYASLKGVFKLKSLM